MTDKVFIALLSVFLYIAEGTRAVGDEILCPQIVVGSIYQTETHNDYDKWKFEKTLKILEEYLRNEASRKSLGMIAFSFPDQIHIFESDSEHGFSYVMTIATRNGYIQSVFCGIITAP